MKLSFQRLFLLVYGFSIVAILATPAYTDQDVATRALPPTDTIESRDDLDAVELEPRFVQAVVQVAKLIFNVVGRIKAGIKEDKNKRSGFTQDLVGQLNAKDPKLNYVICHTKHTTAFDGVSGKDWGHSHQEFDVKIGGTVGYEIYWAKSGKFTRKGDGGFLNWAYIGNIKSKSSDGKVITFGPR
ncbi:hypothetical protein Hypma_016156 [Hypsizygus marmoreus]|uniref:Stress response protein YvgO n=1 Tax=Hypsizygus marmoreus TaxID=39966 RepID=A0A369J7Y2_HYPMA|nr:hypothetical protein Hypma_016156 [Hypsizygus marmoreus]